MPTPRAAAAAVLVMLAFGMAIGSAIEPIAESAGIAPILLDVSHPTAPAAAPEQSTVTAPEAEAEASPLPAASSAGPSAPTAPPAEPAPIATPPPKTSLPPELPTESLPPVKHVFLIVLTGHGFQEAFGAASTPPYLAKTLAGQGELLSNYYAVAQGDLANEIALLSGQGPNPETVAGCPSGADIAPGTVGAEEQIEGSGCLYPTATLTLPGQLAAAGKRWKAYVEAEAGQPAPAACASPFSRFHSLADGAECAEAVAGLEWLGTDLKSASDAPALSYIVPNACHDGSEQPCEAGQPAGLAAAEPFLRTVVPEIEESAAYKDGGLIAITFAEAPQSGPHADPSACCGTPAYPNLPPAPAPTASNGPVKPSGGGGRVGLLLISPFVKPGSVNETGYYDHFSLLLSIEELFGLKPLGYAANPALSAFDATVFNATP